MRLVHQIEVCCLLYYMHHYSLLIYMHAHVHEHACTYMCPFSCVYFSLCVLQEYKTELCQYLVSVYMYIALHSSCHRDFCAEESGMRLVSVLV